MYCRGTECLLHWMLESVHTPVDFHWSVCSCLIEWRSLNRFVSRRLWLIKKPHAPKLFTVKQAYLFIGLSYLFSIFWVVLPLFGWSYYDFEVGTNLFLLDHRTGRSLLIKGTGISCSIQWQKKSWVITSYLCAIFFGVFLIPLVAMVIVNWKIIRCVSIFRNPEDESVERFGFIRR